MSSALSRFLRPEAFEDYRRAQAARLVHYMLLVAFFVTVVTGCLNLAEGWYREAAALLTVAAVSAAGVVLSHRRRLELSAITLYVASFAGIFLAAYFGEGLYDEAMFAFPIFILAAAFLFGRRSGLVLATLASIAAAYVLYVLQVRGSIGVDHDVNILRPTVASILFLAMAGVAWVVRASWDTTMSSLVESYEETLRGWARALEYKGGDIAGHSQRVTDMSVALARRLDGSAEELDAIRRGAYLHDIGKMAIPDDILLKPGPLDFDERRVIERHPAMARSLVADIPFLRTAVPVAYAHHERWDGAGYPEGLKGNDIPRVARIFAVADQWDALSSDRPYREAWPRTEVIEYMRANTGTIYDPQVIAVLMELLDEGGEGAPW